MKKICVMIILLAMFFVLLGGCIKNEYIVIGAVLPLTGEAGEFGQYAKQGIDLAVKNINLSGGINGKQIKVIYEDDELMPKKSALAFQKLITTDNVNYVIGFGSGETLAMCPLAEENKIILMSSGSSPEISNCGEFTFRNYPSDNFQGKVLAENIYALGVRNVFLTYSNTDYGKGLHNVFVKSFKDLGGTITVDESYAFGNNDYKIILSKIKNNTVDAVVFFPNSNQEIISFFNQKSEFGLNIPVYGSEVFYNKDILDTSEDYSDLYFVAISNYGGAEYNNFKSEYLNDYNSSPGLYSDYVYDNIITLSKAINDCEDTICVKDKLYNIDYIGTTGRIRFDLYGDRLAKEYDLYSIIDKQFVKEIK